jgi:hypothetical protein
LEIVFAVSFKILWLIPSSPEALLTFKIFKISTISDSLILISVSLELVLKLKVGNGELESSTDEIETKKSFKHVALS